VPVRVLHVLCDQSDGGAERLVLELCRRHGDAVRAEVIAVQDGGDLAPTLRTAGVLVSSAHRRPRRIDPRAILRLARAARGFDIVHTHLWLGDVYGRLAATLARTPIIVGHQHGFEDEEPEWKRRLKDATAGRATATIAVSHAVAAALRDRGVPPERIHVIHNGVDRTRFAAPWRGGGPLLAIGRLVPAKGLETLLAAMWRLRELRLDVIGDGPLRASLEAAAPPNVRFLGHRDDVPALLAGASALIVPSRREGFGVAAAEGLAAGVPVIASAVDGLREVLGDAGILVPPGDPGALIGAIRRVIDGDVATFSARSRLQGGRFDIRTTVAAVEALYENLRRGT
jgi:glycosyltransferase involved in cell wall biosynthesis